MKLDNVADDEVVGEASRALVVVSTYEVLAAVAVGVTDGWGPSFPMAPRIAMITPAVPTVEMMLTAHCMKVIFLYHGASGGGTQTAASFG